MDVELHRVMKQINRDGAAIVSDGTLARNLVKKPTIKKLRQKGLLYVGWDRGKLVTIFYKKPKY